MQYPPLKFPEVYKCNIKYQYIKLVLKFLTRVVFVAVHCCSDFDVSQSNSKRIAAEASSTVSFPSETHWDQTIHSSSTAGPRTQPSGRIMIEGDRELSAMVQELWDNDVNRLKPGKDYRISLQVNKTHTQTLHTILKQLSSHVTSINIHKSNVKTLI